MSTKTMTMEKEKMKKLRIEVSKEMMEKDLKIKDMAEEILRLKVEKNLFDSNQKSLINMNTMREEMKAADNFIKTVLKDNLMNYEIISKVVEEDEIHKGKVSKKKIVEKFNKDSLSKINFDNCNCSTCMINKKLYESNRKTPNFVSNFNLTDRLFLAAHFDNTMMMMQVDNEEDKAKKITFKDKKTRAIMMDLKFIWRKNEDKASLDIKFSNHENSYIELMRMDNLFKVSLSSFLVVKAMRENQSNHLDWLEKVNNMKDENNSYCFCKMFNNLMGKFPLDKRASNMEDLLEEEEMELLTSFGDTDIYYFVHEGNMTSKNNHISNEMFEGAIKMKLYMLSTPMLRKVFFFSDPEEDYVEVSVDSKMTLDISNEETENTNNNLDEEYNKYFLSVYKDFQKFQGNLIGDFAYHQFIKMHSNKGWDSKVLDIMFQSRLSNCFFQNPYQEIGHLVLMHMPYGLFLMILIFTKDLTAFSDLVFSSPLSSMKNCLTNMKNQFAEVMIERENLSQSEMKEKWFEAMKKLPNNFLFADPMFKRMFFEFKRKVYYQIMFWKMSREMQFNLNSIWKSSSVEAKVKEDFITKLFYDNQNKFSKGTMVDITRYQPSFKLGGTFTDWNHLDLMETNTLLEFIRDEDSKVRKN